jgi:hypothetical protein
VSSPSDIEEREVDEGEWRGESKGETSAVDGAEASISMEADVTVLLKTGFLAAGRLEVMEAILCGLTCRDY